MLKLLQQLITFKSTSYQELELMRFISQLLNQKNIPHVFDQYIPAQIDSQLPVTQPTANIYVEMGLGKQPLILYAHTDVVDAGPDQFIPSIKEDKLYGRGTVDMKTAVATLLQLLLTDYERLKNLNRKIIFIFIADEETSATGIRRFIQWYQTKNYQTPYCILMEPTDHYTFIENSGRGYIFYRLQGRMQAILASFRKILRHKKQIIDRYGSSEQLLGISSIELTKINAVKMINLDRFEKTTGISCHASRPEKGKNALETALKQNKELDCLVTSREEGPNTLPSAAYHLNNDKKYHDLIVQAHIDVRTNLKASHNNAIHQELAACFSPQLDIHIKDQGQPFKVDDRAFIEMCCKSCPHPVQPRCSFEGSDAPYLLPITPYVIAGFGPGNKSLCHKKDEHIEISTLDQSIEIVTNLINNYQSGLKPD